MPTLNQRRQSPRIEVGRPCRLILPDANVAAKLDDVSRNGCGIICKYPLSEGQPVVLELDDGRRLDATVARRVGERVGLSLARPLAGDDPLFRSDRRPV